MEGWSLLPPVFTGGFLLDYYQKLPQEVFDFLADPPRLSDLIVATDPPKLFEIISTNSLDTNPRIPYNRRMAYPDNDIEYYDDELSDLSREDAIAELMNEGYSEEEATRMIGDYDPEEYHEHDDDIPEMEDFDAEDFVDEEDFD